MCFVHLYVALARFCGDGSQFHSSSCDCDGNHNNNRSIFICTCSSNMNKHYFLYFWLLVGCSHLTSACDMCGLTTHKTGTEWDRTHSSGFWFGTEQEYFLWEWDGTVVKIHLCVTLWWQYLNSSDAQSCFVLQFGTNSAQIKTSFKHSFCRKCLLFNS